MRIKISQHLIYGNKNSNGDFSRSTLQPDPGDESSSEADGFPVLKRKSWFDDGGNHVSRVTEAEGQRSRDENHGAFSGGAEPIMNSRQKGRACVVHVLRDISYPL